MTLLTSSKLLTSSQSQLADAWDAFRTAVPAAIQNTTEQLKDIARNSAQIAIHTGASLVSGSAGAVMSATVAELAGHVIESRLYELTTPLEDPSLSHSIRDRLRLEIHNQAGHVIGEETSRLRRSGEPDLRDSSPLKDSTLPRHENHRESSPFDTLLAPQKKWGRGIVDRHKEETLKNSHQLVPRSLKLF